MRSVLMPKSFPDIGTLFKRSSHKKIIIGFFTCITIALLLNALIPSSNNTISSATTPGHDKNWKLIFDDEFNGSSLDTTKWVPCFRWETNAGCASTTTPQSWYSPSNVIVSNGTLKLRAQKQPITENGKTYPYTSAMITTGPLDDPQSPAKFLFTYGYMEIRAKVPKGHGLWPAFWALPMDDSGLPEIDISEIITGGGLTTYTNTMTYHVTDDNKHSSGADWTSPVDLAANFHTYAADWEPDGIHWYVDGVERRSAFTDRKNITAKQMYLLVQLEVGGSWPGNPDSSTPFPSVYEVDYVRVWQHPQ